MIDLDALIPESSYFRWRDFLFCSQWAVHVYPTPIQHKNLIHLAKKMDAIRNRLGVPLRITSGLRPPRYNELVRGAPASAHCEGKACDFQPIVMTVDEAKLLLTSQLEQLELRMEDDTQNWIHVDTRIPLLGQPRLFKR